MIGLLAHTQMFLAIQNAISDPYIDKVVSLMPFRGLDGNNAFVDRMGKVWTATGTAKLGLGGKFGSGLLLDGGSYIASPPHTDLALGTGDFTIEGWVYPTSNGVSGYNLVFLGTATSFGLYVAGDRKLVFYTGTSYKGTIDIPLNTWTYIAWTRSSGIVNTYVNGIKDVTVASFYNVGSTANTVLGGYPSAAGVIGYIDDFRVTKGVARYTSNFTPPNKENYLPTDPYISNVSSLLHFSKDFRDATGKIWTTSGTVAVSATQNKFWGNSAFFTDGAMISGPSSDYTIGTGDFTVEFWFYHSSTVQKNIFGVGPSSSLTGAGANGPLKQIYTTDSVFWWDNTSVGQINGPTLTLNTWHHIAVARQSGTSRLFVDGVVAGAVADPRDIDATYAGLGTGTITIKNAYVQDVRITKGIARYTKNFTPPNYPHPTDDYFENVVSLLHFDGANGSTTFTDEAGRVWTKVGAGTQISSTQYKFTGASGAFPGAVAGSNYITTLFTEDMSLAAEFTMECWIYTTARGASNQSIYSAGGSANKGALFLGISPTGQVNISRVWIASLLNSTGVIPLNTWTHIAVVRGSDNILQVFINGVKDATTVVFSGIFAPSPTTGTSAYIGGTPSDPSVSGYIDDFRFTKGIARYSKNFTPPTRPFIL